MQEFLDHLWVFFISMLPIVELRGAIPAGALLGLPLWSNYLVSVVGNFLPVPFILLFIRRILSWMKTTRHFAKIALWLEEKAEKKTAKVMKYATFGLFLFVAIPLPATGAWTGTLVAALFDMKFWKSLLSALLGVLIAGVVMTLISYGVVAAWGVLF